MAELSAQKFPPLRKLPVLAIVGRPNVGKSTLFNRLVGGRKAIVDDVPGVTRDRNYGESEWAGRRFVSIDTGGLETQAAGSLEKRVQEQSRIAVAEADVVLFLFDGKAGLNPLDQEAIELLRKTDKPVFFAVNKIDTKEKNANLYEFYALGLDRLFALSAEHGIGLPELMDQVVAAFSQAPEREAAESAEPQGPSRVAIVGRPNVGKSTLINRLLGFERSVVDALPGTTRDAIDTPFIIGREPCVLVDTAGMRRKARIGDRIERYSVSRSLRSVDRGDLVIHLIDGPEGVTDQDAQILAYAHQRGKALLLAVNKWDLVLQAGEDVEAYRDHVRRKLSFLDFVPLAFVSAATGAGVRKLLETAARVLRAHGRKIPTSRLNQALQEIVREHPAPLNRGRPVKFFYATQTGTRPPTFTLFANSPHAVPAGYQRYLVHRLRAALGLDHAPIRLVLRARREDKKGRKP